MSKGISPVVASILVVLIVIGLAGTFLTFSGSLTEETTGAVEETAGRATELTSSRFLVQGIKDRRVFVKNAGENTIEVNSFRVTIEGEEANYTMDGPIEPDGSGTLTLTELWRFGPGERTLRIEGEVKTASETMRIRPTDGAVLDMRFEEGSGEVANDLSGNNNDGTLKNDPEWRRGRFGGALDFDGTDDYVGGIPDSINDRIDDSVTVAAWVKASDFSTSNWQGIVTEKYNPNNNDVLFEIAYDDNAGKFKIGFYDGSWHIVSGSINPSPDTWYFITGTYDGSELKFYRNGELQDTVSDSAGLPPGDLDWEVGRRHDIYGDSSNYWNGLIDDILVYNRAISPDELYLMESV